MDMDKVTYYIKRTLNVFFYIMFWGQAMVS